VRPPTTIVTGEGRRTESSIRREVMMLLTPGAFAEPMASTGPADQDVSMCIDDTQPSRKDPHGSVLLLHDRWAGDHGAWPKVGPAEDGHI
jgi:hypothetical protein